MVVHHIGKIVGRIAVGLDENHIIQLAIVYGNISIYFILEGGGSFGRVILSDNIRGIGCQFFFYLFFGQMQAMFVINVDLLPGHGLI